MAITRKPKAAGTAVNVDELINSGGKPGGQTAETADATTAVVLRIPIAMLQQIDAAVKTQPSRHPGTAGYSKHSTRSSRAKRNSSRPARTHDLQPDRAAVVILSRC